MLFARGEAGAPKLHGTSLHDFTCARRAGSRDRRRGRALSRACASRRRCRTSPSICRTRPTGPLCTPLPCAAASTCVGCRGARLAQGFAPNATEGGGGDDAAHALLRAGAARGGAGGPGAKLGHDAVLRGRGAQQRQQKHRPHRQASGVYSSIWRTQPSPLVFVTSMRRRKIIQLAGANEE